MHILTCSRDNDDRIKKYEIWLPLFITYLGYPFIRLTYIGYPNLEKYLHATIMQADSAAIFPIIFILGVGFLLLFSFMLELCYKFDFRKIFLNLLIVATILYFFLFLWLYGKKELLSPFHKRKIFLVDFLSPYNFIRPFIGAFIGFLKPFSTALKIDSTMPYHYVIMEGSIVSVLLTLFFIFIFIKKFVMRHKDLIIFFVLYGIALPNMWRKGTSMPSRYFVYITPLFSVIFCSVFLYLYTLFIK